MGDQENRTLAAAASAGAEFPPLETASVALRSAQLPRTIGEARKVAGVIGAQRKRPLPISGDYVHIAVHSDFTKETFNGVENLVTQSAQITGVKLIFDDLDHESPVRSFDKRFDLRNLTIYADQVIFRSEHHFYRTNVTIYARELIFEDDGCIDTTPRAQRPKPFTTRDAEGYPPNYKVADGSAGEPAGNVTLYVHDILIKGNDQRARVVCQGQAGQDGEDGGLKRYSPGKSDVKQPPAADGKDVQAISLDELKRKLGDLNHVASNFHYPDYAEGHVVSASVVAYVPVFPFPILDQFFLPGPAQLDAVKFESFGKPDFSFWWSSIHGKRPGDGEDAYPSGTPGAGGNGGSISVECHGQCPANFAKLCLAEGGKGGSSIGVKGGEAGKVKRSDKTTTTDARHAIVFIPRSDADGDGLYKRKPFVKYQDVSNYKAGASCDPQTGKSGDRVTPSIRNAAKSTWMHPLLVDAVLVYARDAYRNGYRQDAQDVLDRYRVFLGQDGLPAELLPRRTAIVGLLNNLANNLDYYGHNIGWVPRLNVATTFGFFERDRATASALIYYAQTLANKWDKLKRASAAANAAAGALNAELDLAQKEIVNANEAFVGAKKSLDAIDTDLKDAKLQFQSLFDRATLVATQHVKLMDTVKGMCKLAGGLAKVVPVGQPYLGLAGDVVAEIGDFEWTDADGKFTWDQVASNFDGFGKNLGEKIDKFRDDHKELLIKDELKAGKASLKQKVSDAKGAIKNIDDEVETVNAEIEQDWTKLRDGELTAIRARIKEIDDQLAKAPPEQKPALDEKKLSLAEELQKVANERLYAAKVRLQSELAHKTSQLEEKEKARKQALRDKVEALQEKKANKQKAIADLEKKEELREKKTKEVFEAMNGVGDGVASIGAGVSKIFAKVDPENPKVKALLKNIETSELFDAAFKKDFRNFRDRMDEIGARKTEAISRLLSAQQQITRYTASISSGLTELVALGRQRQSLDGVLGVEVRQYLGGIEQRAKDRLQAYLYEFIKASQYHYLRDVPDALYDFTSWTGKLTALESVSPEGVVTPPSLAKIRETEEQVIRSEYAEMARQIVADRHKYAGSSTNSYRCTLDNRQLETLRSKGSLTFNILTDFDTHATLAAKFARIVDVNLTTFTLALAEGVRTPNVNISFEHSGTSILLDDNGQFWFFQKGEHDDPISWRYIWKGPKPEELTKDVKIETDAVLDKLLNGDQVKFREHMPGLFSDITLWINKDPNESLEERMRGISSIKELVFKVEFIYNG